MRKIIMTANDAASCKAAQPFFWEVGNAESPLAGGQAGDKAPTAQTKMALASASKWLYGAFVAQEREACSTRTNWQRPSSGAWLDGRART